MVRRIRPTRFPLGDVYAELHFMKSNTGVVSPPFPTQRLRMQNTPAHRVSVPQMPTLLADTVCVTAMLYRFCIAYGIY